MKRMAVERMTKLEHRTHCLINVAHVGSALPELSKEFKILLTATFSERVSEDLVNK